MTTIITKIKLIVKIKWKIGEIDNQFDWIRKFVTFLEVWPRWSCQNWEEVFILKKVKVLEEVNGNAILMVLGYWYTLFWPWRRVALMLKSFTIKKRKKISWSLVSSFYKIEKQKMCLYMFDTHKIGERKKFLEGIDNVVELVWDIERLEWSPLEYHLEAHSFGG